MTRTARQKIVRALAGLCTLVVAFVVVTAVRLWPWIKMPDEPPATIHARWHEAMQWAKTDEVQPEMPELLQAARLSKPPLDAFGPKPVDSTPLSERELQALSAFDIWSRSGNPIAAHSRTDDGYELNVLALYTLVKLVLRAAPDASHLERLRSCARLGAGLRNRRLFVDALVGYAVAGDIAEWANSKSVPLSEIDGQSRPLSEELHGALAREGRARVQLFESNQGPFPFEIEKNILHAEQWPPFGIVRRNREILVQEYFYSRMLTETYPYRDDLPRMARAVDAIVADAPRTVFRGTWPMLGDKIRRVGEQMQTYEQIRSGARQ